MKKILLLIITVVVLVVSVMSFLYFMKPKYKVDYNGEKEHYSGAKDYYRAGQKVTVYFNFVGTDTDYTFYLNGEEINANYDYKKGFKISFIMPNEDVTLSYDEVRSMIRGAPQMLVNYYTKTTGTSDESGYYEMVLETYYTDAFVRLKVYNKSEDSNETCVSYIVPSKVADECYDIIKSNELYKWDSIENSVSIDGRIVVCKFLYNSNYYRVSTDKMPDENGVEILDSGGDVMSKYIKDEYLESK